MENGGENFENKFAGLVLKDSNHNGAGNEALFQVMKAVEAAEVTIKQQEDENNQLRAVNRKLEQELEAYKSGQFKVQGRHLVNHLADGHLGENQYAFGASFLPDRIQHLDNNSTLDNNFVHEFSNRTILHNDLVRNDEDLNMQRLEERNSDSCKANGMLNILAGGQAATDNLGFSQLSSPSTTSFSPNRYQTHGVFNPQSFSGQGLMPMTELNNSSNLNELFSSQLSLSGQGLMPVTELNNSSTLKQDLSVKIRDHEEEILRLRKHLGEYSMKEAQIRNEKFVLEKRIAYMRMAFDQQQQDLVDAASKAISYRQDIIEENIRLTYALQSAQQERSTFISSLMPLLAEYSFEPTVADAQSIASNMKVLFRHMQEKLLVTEAKLKESQYQLAPWRSDLNQLNFSPSPPHSSEIKNGLELVAQSQYSNQKMPLSSEPQTSTDWDLVEPSGLSSSDVKNAESDDLGRYPPLASRDATSQDLSTHAVNPGEPNTTHKKDETTGKQVKFKDLVSSEMEESELEGQQNDRESSVNWSSKSMGYTATIEDPSTSYSPYLPPVLEEPSSSFSEAGDEDPLPAIEGLQISGEAFPGRELQACGFSINGTTSCNFEWVRHMEDGSFNYIDGAKQPNYHVTADDVDAYLAIEVQPLDNRKRKGELVKVFANGHRKISCDQEMQNCIEKTFYGGHASYKLFLSRGYLDIWEPATLGIKRDGYSIKCSGSSGVVVSEKFSPSTIVSLPYGSLIEFSIIDGQGIERLLRTENGLNDISCSRDTIVLTLRLFISRFNEKKKGKKRGLFFNK